MYTAKLCNSIDKYIDTKSELEIKKDAPIVVNRIINGNSAIAEYDPFSGTTVVADRLIDHVAETALSLENAKDLFLF